jgi:hypothetical protein
MGLLKILFGNPYTVHEIKWVTPMRFANGRDYYDKILAFGRDETLFFDRSQFAKAKFVTVKEAGFTRGSPGSLDFRGELSWRKYSSLTIHGREYQYTPHVVWFAGECFAGIKLEIRENHWHPRPAQEPQWFWGREAFVAHLKSLQEEQFKGNWNLETVIREDSLHRLFDYTPTKADMDWMVANKVAIAVYSDHYYHGEEYYGSTEPGWYLNCDGLSAMGFAKALGPYSAFQKLSQWIGGVLSVDNKPMIKITDEKVILKKHGFDQRSFKHR